MNAGIRYDTQAPAVDVAALFPDLRQRSLTTVRLHPRPVDGGQGRSHFGGVPLWPSTEDWPRCVRHRTALVPVLQISRDDVPELGFPDETDLFQMFWCPRDHGDGMPWTQVHWRRSLEIGSPLNAVPAPWIDEADRYAHDTGDYLVERCAVYPERVVEYPRPDELPRRTRRAIRRWKPQTDVRGPFGEPEGKEPGLTCYAEELSAAPGSKVGGWPRWVQHPEWPSCASCGDPMEHLLTLATLEEFWPTRWCTAQDLPRALGLDYEERLKAGRSLGIEIGDGGSIYAFLCRRCPYRPIRNVTQCY